MATPVKTSEHMSVGGARGGKHWTSAEVEARQRADDDLTRDAVSVRVPEWLSDEARRVWYSVLRRARALRLLDNLDAEILGIYCDAVAHYTAASDAARSDDASGDDVRSAQAWARIVSTYADRLGMSPNSRARLVKGRADSPRQDSFGAEFDS